MMQSERNQSIPDDILEQILLVLPVKSLLRFRCVSKSWCSLIDSERFAEIHLQNSKKKKNLTHHIFIVNSLPHGTLRGCSLNSLLNDPVSFAFDDSCHTLFTWNKSSQIVGCCNGLVCYLVAWKHFVLWNPATRTSKTLPAIDNKINYYDCEFHKLHWISGYGFGFDESDGDYKVFGILYDSCMLTNRLEVEAKVYSMKNNSWKTIKDSGKYLYSSFSREGKLANGKLHWGRGGVHPSALEWDIVSFDLKNEVYGVVEQPSYTEPEDIIIDKSLGVVGGCLCVLRDCWNTRLDVWVLKKYGANECWDKLATIPYLDRPTKNIFTLVTKFCIGPNTETLMVYGPDNFMIYYPKNDRFITPHISEFGRYYEADIYIESLVSLC